MTQSSDSSRAAITVALITAIATIVAAVLGGPFLIKLFQGGNAKDSDQAEYTVVAIDHPSKILESSFTISIDGYEIGTIFTSKRPTKATETIAEGNHPYSVTGVIFTEVPNLCEEGQELSGSGNLSIQNGDKFEIILTDCSEGTVSINELQ